MEIIPLWDYVLIEEEVVKNTSDSGIIIPGATDTEPTNIGTIRGMPSNMWSSTPSSLAVGVKVLFKPHMFDDVVMDKKHYRFGKQEHVVAILKD